MNILHTSDWHIGKRLMDRDRLPEQIEALHELTRIAEEKDVSVVLVAGDIFDTYLPPAEAEETFFHAVKELAGAKRAVIVIPGNHDDGVRLAASAPIAEQHGVYLFGSRGGHFLLKSDRPVRAVEAGENHLILQDEKGERIYINALPYPNEARLKEEKTEESYSEKVSRWIASGEAGFHGGMPHILLSHLFVAGGKASESERDIDLGGARAVPLSLFEGFGYVALGHLHKPQKMKNVRYSGSLLQYSFDEAGSEKCVLLLETKGEHIEVKETIPLTSGRQLVRLECTGAEQAVSLLRQYEGAFIELTLHLNSPLSSEETRSLRAANEGLVSLITRVEGAGAAPFQSRSKLTSSELFTQYYKSIYDAEPDEALLTAFLELLKEDA